MKSLVLIGALAFALVTGLVLSDLKPLDGPADKQFVNASVRHGCRSELSQVKHVPKFLGPCANLRHLPING